MSIETDLQEENIGRLDLSGYASVQKGTVIREVLDIMRNQRVSAILVEEESGKLAGIFTERDVLNKVVDAPATWNETVETAMTPSPEALRSEEPVGHALRLMNAGHYRNVPILAEDGSVAGNLSQHAIIQFLTDRFPTEIYNLPPDPEIVARTREGA